MQRTQWPAFLRTTLVVLALASLAGAQMRARSAPPPAPVSGPPAAGATAPFRVLDNVEGDTVDLLPIPRRPMLLTSDGGHLYAVNSHGSLVLHFDNTSGNASQVFPVPSGPVSIAQWQSTAGPGFDQLLVVCQTSRTLARLDRLTGRIQSLIALEADPGDLIVDPATDRAFVACSGTDAVLEIDLQAGAVQRHVIRGKHPAFLAFDAQMRVLVAPMFSGNNSIAIANPPGTTIASLLDIIDLDTNPFVTQGLPDEDLFRIDPALDTVTAVSKGAGTVLFAHGVNPVTGAHWQLNTEADNKDPNKQSEPALRGIFAKNRLTITDLAQYAGQPITQHQIVDLDDTNPATPATDFDPAKLAVVGQPYQLAFATGGFALVVGLLSNNITVCDPQGAPFFRWQLAPGSIPRQVMTDISGQFAFVYCWGTNRIDAWQVTPVPSVVFSLRLGVDPTPVLVKEGRHLFFDGSNSLHGNVSCATCHVEGGTDMALWTLDGLPNDSKGPLITQTLKGIEKLQPLHWRGERAGLIDFNAAFDKLLGGAELGTLPAGAFEKFQAFVFSMHNPANPHEDRRRIVSKDAGIPSPLFPEVPDAVQGQNDYFDTSTDGQSCNFCHTLPTGTDNDTIFDSAGDSIPHRTFLKVTPFNEMWRKEQPEAPVTFAVGGTSVTLDYPITGGGLTHAGLFDTLFDFVNEVFVISDQMTVDIASFVSQVDQGIAPAAHASVLLDQATFFANRAEVKDFLMPQAVARNIDLCVFGTFTIAGTPKALRWTWNRGTNQFESDDPAVTPKLLDFFLGQARTGQGTMTFVGVPVGAGRVFGNDRDDDGLLNQQEAGLLCDPAKEDTDRDGFSDGYEVLHGSDPTSNASLPVESAPPQVSNLRLAWVSARVARLYWDTDERTTHSISYSTGSDPALTVASLERRRTNTALLTMMKPSSGPNNRHTYAGTLTVRDESGNATSVALPANITTVDGIIATDVAGNVVAPHATVIGNLSWTSTQKNLGAGTLTARAVARLDKKYIVPGNQTSSDHVVIGSVIKNGVLVGGFTSPTPTTFTIGGQPPAFGGPSHVLSNVTLADGLANLEFTLGGLTAGDVIELNIEGVGEIDPAAWNPLAPNFGTAAVPLPFTLWSFPDTPPAFRKIELVY